MEEETLVGPSGPAFMAPTNAFVTPPSEWTATTGMKSMASEEEAVAAAPKVAPVLNPVKEEPFDEDGYLKETFQSQFMPLPHRLTR